MSESVGEYLLFPITQKNGFEVDCQANYEHLMYYLAQTTGRLQLEYPENPVLVIWPVSDV